MRELTNADAIAARSHYPEHLSGPGELDTARSASDGRVWGKHLEIRTGCIGPTLIANREKNKQSERRQEQQDEGSDR